MTRSKWRTASPSRRVALAVAAAVLAALLASCATPGSPPPSSMPAARASLRPEYRVFYDELQDYGDWVLIEPYGFVFRPRTRFNTWSPYWDGFWSPSDSYGWVWVSGEPFGWATYHYGAWLNDSYQGWVWVPGLEWAPAWVAWTGNQSYVGWAALAPNGAPAGRFTVVPVAELGTTDLRSHTLPPDRANTALSDAKPIENYAEIDHATVNRGPSIDWVERVSGPLKRVRLEDASSRLARGSWVPTGSTAANPRPADTPKQPSTREFKRTAESVAAEARTLMQEKQPAPAVIARIRLEDVPPRTPAPKSGWRPAKRDTAKKK